MTETSLRAYIREIDNLIEQEKLDEAIAHCRHILQSYPKHIECYRLLGKAYLEAKRFGDAADIFQRVLSAVPDDFVSHIGMSLVREDEGNTDAAIWHMERAFETNPANPAIQQELKRLIGQRDGFEPHKVRLTRGALARMYSHGELYPQAIAELRSALREDPDRPDLQVLLAQMYWQTDQRKEAAAVSGDVLKKLPYCLPATRITAAVLQSRGKTEEAAAYHRRLAQLEPYMAYSEVPMIEASRIDSDSIVLQRLSWRPGQPLPATDAGPADWATSLGLEPDEGGGPGTGPLPSWLEEVEPDEAFEGTPSRPTPQEPAEPPAPTMEEAPTQRMEEPSPTPEPEAEEEAELADEIPDWMSEAGWQESSGEAEEQQVSFSSEELAALEQGELPAAEEPSGEAPEEEDTGELEPAEIPGWLQGMAPADEDEGIEEGDEELEALLRSQEPAPTEVSPAEEPEADLPRPEVEPKAAAEGEGGAMPSWLDEGEPGATSTIMTWLGDRGDEEQAPEPSEPTDEPDWMPEAELEEAPTPSEPEAEEEQVPGWLSGVAEAAAGVGEAEEEELAELRRRAGAEEPATEQEPEPTSGEAVPDWIQSITGEESEAPSAEAEPQEEEDVSFAWEAEMAAAEQETVPQSSDEGETPVEEEPGAAEAAESQAPDWLASFREAEEPAEAEPTEVEAEFEEDWLSGLGEEAETAESASWLEQLGEPEAEAEAPARRPAEAVPDWMAGLEEEEPEPAEAEVEDIASGWLDDLSDTLAETPAEPEMAEELAEEEESAPEWLASLGSEAERDEMAAQAEPEGAEDDLAWLDSLDADEAPTELPAEFGSAEPEPTAEVAEPTAEAAELESFEEDEVFKWLDQMAAEAEHEDLGPSGEEQFPSGGPSETAEVSDEVPPESLEEGLDWLERLADARGIDADVSIETAAQPPAEQAPVEPKPAATEEPPPPPPAAEEEPAPTMRVEPPVEAEEPEAEPEPTVMVEPPPAVEPEEEPAPPATEQPAPPAEAAEDLPVGPEMMAPAMEDIEGEEEEVPAWLLEHGEGFSLTEEPGEELEPTEPPAPAAEVEAPSPPAEEPPEAEPTPPPAAPERAAPTAEEPPPAPAVEEPSAERPAAPPEGEPAPQEPERATPTPEGPIPAEIPEPQEPEPEADPALQAARQSLRAGEREIAARQYGELIKERRELEAVVQDLEAALADDPDAPRLWQTLGDAYMRINRSKDAVKAYNRGMEETEVLDSARQALAAGDIDRATTQYGILIKHRTELETVIHDLEQAVESGDGQPALWQTLGDAYMKAGRVDDSIRAYRQGMESV